jgi:hypothetical protein
VRAPGQLRRVHRAEEDLVDQRGLAQRVDDHQRLRVRGHHGRPARVPDAIDGSSNLVDQQTYFQGTYDRLRTVEVDHDGDIWLTTTTDKDGQPNNDRVLLVDIVYSGGGGWRFDTGCVSVRLAVR